MLLLANGKDKRSDLNKEPEVSDKQGDSAKRVRVSNAKRSHLNKKSGVHIEQRASPEQGVGGLK